MSIVRRSRTSQCGGDPEHLPAAGTDQDHESVGDPPTILLQGSLHYGPNMDAVEWLLGKSHLHCGQRSPGPRSGWSATPCPGSGAGTARRPVTVVGSVPDMEPELARADIAVVPLRIGSGTRLKILESFAHRVPVVSTTIGADGLDVRDGVHLLLADTAEDFASACQRLLVDVDLRKRLMDAAESLYLRQLRVVGRPGSRPAAGQGRRRTAASDPPDR